MRRIAPFMVALMLATTAVAGPSVKRSLVSQLPAEAVATADVLEVQVDQLEEAEEIKERQWRDAKAEGKALKLELKAVKAQVKADKAERKAAKKAGDAGRVTEARAAMEASDAQVAELEAAIDRHKELVKLLKAQLDQIVAQQDLKDAERQVIFAQAVNEHVEPYSDAKMRGARAKAEIKFQQARRAVGQAEARYAAAGGVDVPNAMLAAETMADPEMGPSEIETGVPDGLMDETRAVEEAVEAAEQAEGALEAMDEQAAEAIDAIEE